MAMTVRSACCARTIALVRRTIMGLLSAVLLVAVACGGGDDADVEVSLDRIADATRSAVTARFEVDVAVDDEVQARPQHWDGIFDFESLNGTIRWEREDDQVWDSVADSTTVVGGAAYLPALDDDVPVDDPCAGKAWYVFDYPRYEREGFAVEADQVAPVPVDPSRVLEELDSLDAALDPLAEELVRAATTTHYRVTGDLAPLLPVPDPTDWEVRTVRSFDIWVDAEGRLRKVVTVEQVRWGGEPGRQSEDAGREYEEMTTVELWDYGVTVDVTAPPAEETCDFPEFFARTMATFD
jgi:hypothetical protein